MELHSQLYVCFQILFSIQISLVALFFQDESTAARLPCSNCSQLYYYETKTRYGLAKRESAAFVPSKITILGLLTIPD